MSDEFFCFNCNRWKPLSCKSDQRMSKSWVCTACKEKIAKKLRPEGWLSRLTPEHLEKGRENKRKRNGEVYRSRQAYRDAESLAKKLRGD